MRIVIEMGTVFDWLYNAGRWTWHDPDGYNFISGPLADITLLGGAYALLRHHNCHAKGCWRIGRHAVEGTGYVVCRKHHPRSTPTAEQILDEHAAYRQQEHEARSAAAAAVRDVRHVAHEVAGDVHHVAQDTHDVAQALREESADASPPTARRTSQATSLVVEFSRGLRDDVLAGDITLSAG